MNDLLSAPALVPLDWKARLDHIVETMRDMSRHTDPQEMVRAYGARMRSMRNFDRLAALSRRDLSAPWYRITRSSLWEKDVNPWTEREKLPLLSGGVLGELLYAQQPVIIDELQVSADDPAYEYLAGQHSLAAVPNFDRGESLNMVILTREQPFGFEREEFPEQVWVSNLFGRATHNLVLSERLQAAYDAVDHEMKMVADIQRSLLPATLPQIPGLELAAHYQTSHRAGGDYYDFFPLPEGKWGIMIADVSGHGTAAAVMMAVTHSIAHAYPGPPAPAGKLLEFVNNQLARRYTSENGTFVTAFYGIYDPATRRISYASAGHNPPRLKRCRDGSRISLDEAGELPLGIVEGLAYPHAECQLYPGDQLLFYTDGITEATGEGSEQFGADRLDQALGACRDADGLIQEVLAQLDRFTGGRPADDDRTLLIAKAT